MAIHATNPEVFSYMGGDGCPCLGFMPGPPPGFLGGLDSAGYDVGESAGIPDSVLSYLDDIGATDGDITNMADNGVSLTAVLSQYGATPSMMPAQAQTDAMNAGLLPGGTTQASTTAAMQTAAAASAAPAAQVPSGSVLLYSVTWTAGISNLNQSPASVIAALNQQLPAHGMTVQSSSATSSGPITYGIQVQILDSIGNALKSDALSVIHSIVTAAVGQNLASENLSIVANPATAATGSTTGAPAGSFSAWLEQNGTTVAMVGAAALVAVVILPPLIKKL